MTKQEQSVEQGGEAYQAGRDIVITKSFEADDIAKLMMAMAQQLSAYTEQANAKLDQRLNEFRDEVVRQFLDSESSNKAAFNDPDFQFTVKDAQEAFARSGDGDLKSELVRLLAERSKSATGSRRANIINEAIRIGGLLTREDMATLSVIFFMLNVGLNDARLDQARFIFERYLSPFVADLPKSESSFEYLSSLGCMTSNAFLSRSVSDILSEKFKGQFAGISEGPQIESEFAKSGILKMVFDVWNENRQFQGANLTMLGKVLAHSSCVSRGGFDAPLEIWIG